MSIENQRVEFRPMMAADLAPALYARKYALESLVRSEGREPFDWNPGVDHAQLHILTTDPGGSWVATIRGLVVGFAQAFVRGEIWFLSQLFVHPEVHARGIGQELLRLAMQYGRDARCDVFSVVSSTSPVAQSLYMRAGMFGLGIGYRLVGSVESLCDLPHPGGDTKTILDLGEWQDRIAELDRTVFGAERRQEHACYVDDIHWPGGNASFGLVSGSSILGYGYATAAGFIAPIAAYEPQVQLPLVGMAAEWLHGRAIAETSVWVLSHNHVLMDALLARSWKITNWSFLKANRPFAQFDRYHPAGGILL